jgi:dihydroorotate dehydrogenase (NAD+) catalytic subunit
VHACASAVELPIVGMGGVAGGRDAFDLVAAGASAVALGTVLFADPSAPVRVREELAAEMCAWGVEQAVELRGAASGTPLGSGS